METNKTKALSAALSQIEKQFGKGSVMRLGDGGDRISRSSRPARSASTWRSASAGVPRGRVVEIYGPESSGKTTLTLQIIAECQKIGGTAAFIDAEHALDPAYAKKLGVNIDDLLVSQPDSASRPWKSATCWYVLVRWTWWWSTR